jgi:UDP-N-acetylmuramoyl-tripeptide--D-alanyl-D-alanine ligase
VKPLQLQELLPHIGGVVIKEGVSFSCQNVITRIKNLRAGSLFFCLDRDLFQTEQQMSFPPCIIICDRIDRIKNIPVGATIVKVKNIKDAYLRFLSYYRSLFTIPVIAITGTYGKTTTKEMIRHILSEQFKVEATKGNYNLFRSNSTILANLQNETEFGVFEFGVGRSGNLDRCSRYFGPYTAVITGIGADHIERFDTLERYRLEKSKILNGVGENQVAILNTDCENILKISESFSKKKIVWFGLRENADFRAQNIKYSEYGMEFLLRFNQRNYSISVPGFGLHHVYNVLAAIAATHSNGVDIDLAVNRLKTFRPLRRHLQVMKGLNGSTLIDDTWNTNSGSIAAALDVLNQISKGKDTIAVLGKVSELGVEEENEHKKIAQMVIENQIKKLITIGETASIISKEAIRLGMDPNSVFICKSGEEAKGSLQKMTGPNSVILVKASMRESFKKFLKQLKK